MDICCSSELTTEAGKGDPSILSESFRLDEEDPSLLGRLEFREQFLGFTCIECCAICNIFSTLFAINPGEG
jgi:hypothetical protein